MSNSVIVPGERPSSGLARRWLIAYPLAQLLCLVAIAATTAAADRFDGIEAIDTSHRALAVTIAIAGVYALTFGYLRGCILRERLARFSMLAWCSAIAAVSLFFLPPEPQAILGLNTASSVQTAARAALPFAMYGFLYGVVIGAAEAMSLRRAALGLTGWVLLSGFAWGMAHVAASAGAILIASLELSPIQSGIAHGACMVTQALIAGLVMLPGLKFLAPRLRYYGPRVYRPAVRIRE